MRTRKHISFLILLAIAVAGFVYYLLPPREPTYGGRTLNSWVGQYRTNTWITPDEALQHQAQTAIQHLGTNATPILLRMLSTTESPLRIQLTTHIPKTWLTNFHILGVTEYRQQLDQRRVFGADGLAAMGTNISPTLPALTALLNHPEERVRYLTVFTLRCLGPTAKETLPILIKLLDDPEFTIQDDAVMALGTMNDKSEQVVPVLINFIQKHGKNTILCKDAIDSLKEFKTQAKSSVPMLLGLLNSDQLSIRSTTTNALKEIDPEAAAKAGVK